MLTTFQICPATSLLASGKGREFESLQVFAAHSLSLLSCDANKYIFLLCSSLKRPRFLSSSLVVVSGQHRRHHWGGHFVWKEVSPPRQDISPRVARTRSFPCPSKPWVLLPRAGFCTARPSLARGSRAVPVWGPRGFELWECCVGLCPTWCWGVGLEMHTSTSGITLCSPSSSELKPWCTTSSSPPLLHRRVKTGEETHFPSSVPGHQGKPEKKRKIKDMRRPREMKGQRVGKGEEEGGYKLLPNHCKPSEEIMLG